MDLNIGLTIQKLRRDKGLTQEQLARAVGVSTPAVSKWETGGAYPDITLLPPIARLFRVTVDQLLGFRAQITTQEVLELNRECAGRFETEPFPAALEHCKKIIQEYPDNLYLKFRLAGLIFQVTAMAGNEENLNELISLSTCWMEQAAESGDAEIRNASLTALSSLYLMAGRHEDALHAAKQLPPVQSDPRVLLSGIYRQMGDREASQKLNQECLYAGINSSNLALMSLAKTAMAEKRSESAMELLRLQKELLRLFGLENTAAGISLGLEEAEFTALLGDAGQALSALEQAAALLQGASPSAGGPCFDRLQFSEPIASLDSLRRNLLLAIQQEECFAALHKEARFEHLLKALGGQ